MNIYGTHPTTHEQYIVLDAPLLDGSVFHRSLSGETYLQLVFTMPDRIDLRKGCYVLYCVENSTDEFKFELMSNVYPEYRPDTGGWRYTAKFESQQAHMKHYNVFYSGQDFDEVSFTNIATLRQYADLLAKSMNRAKLGITWAGATEFSDLADPYDIEVKTNMTKTIAFKGDKVWDAAMRVAKEFDCEWWTLENGSVITLFFGKREYGTEVVIREGEIVNRLPARKGDNSNYGTRFYVFGSTRNLDKSYNDKPEPPAETNSNSNTKSNGNGNGNGQ